MREKEPKKVPVIKLKNELSKNDQYEIARITGGSYTAVGIDYPGRNARIYFVPFFADMETLRPIPSGINFGYKEFSIEETAVIIGEKSVKFVEPPVAVNTGAIISFITISMFEMSYREIFMPLRGDKRPGIEAQVIEAATMAREAKSYSQAKH